MTAHSVPNIELSCAVADSEVRIDSNLDSTKSSSVERLVHLTRRLTECRHVFAALEKEEQKLQKKNSNLLDLPHDAHVDASLLDSKSGGEEEEDLDEDENGDRYDGSGSYRNSPRSHLLVENFVGSPSKKPQGGRASSLEVLPGHAQSQPRQKWARLLGLTPSDIGDEAEFVRSAIKYSKPDCMLTSAEQLDLQKSWNAALVSVHFGSLQTMGLPGESRLRRSSSWKSRMALPFFKKSYKQAKSLQQDELLRMISSGKPSYEQVHMWRKSFESLLHDKYGLALFKDFLTTEFSDENIEFWIACENYKKINQPKKMQCQAQRIYEDFIAPQAGREVNLDSATRDQTVAELSNPSARTFENAQKRIQALMERDSYRRFLRSDLYATLLNEAKQAAKALAASARKATKLNASGSPSESPAVGGSRFKLSPFKAFGTGHKGVGTDLPGVLAAAADAEAGINSVQDLQLLGLSTSRHMQNRISLAAGATSRKPPTSQSTSPSPTSPSPSAAAAADEQNPVTEAV
ncbi:Regulator of G-protein signaling 3 [Sparganum proliferum]